MTEKYSAKLKDNNETRTKTMKNTIYPILFKSRIKSSFSLVITTWSMEEKWKKMKDFRIS